MNRLKMAQRGDAYKTKINMVIGLTHQQKKQVGKKW